MTKCFQVHAQRNKVTGAILIRIDLRFEGCEIEDVYRYMEKEFPEWDPIHIIEGYKQVESTDNQV